LTPTQSGTVAHTEQSGSQPKDETNYQGANYGPVGRPA
jgi:hypothetical protein